MSRGLPWTWTLTPCTVSCAAELPIGLQAENGPASCWLDPAPVLGSSCVFGSIGQEALPHLVLTDLGVSSWILQGPCSVSSVGRSRVLLVSPRGRTPSTVQTCFYYLRLLFLLFD